jgi:hypothetical protein
MLWGHASLMVHGFEGSTEVDVPMVCTYDFEVAASKYFHALEEGEIPLLFQFSGTVFAKGPEGFSVRQVPWEKDAPFRLPVSVWREAMDTHFPDSAWLRLRKDSFDALNRFKGQRALTSWEEVIEVLLKEAT